MLPFTWAQEPSQKVVNLFEIQMEILGKQDQLTQKEMNDELVSRLYLPHSKFWAGYCCQNEPTFRYVLDVTHDKTKKNLARHHQALKTMDIEKILSETADSLESLTGQKPIGSWYLVFSLGQTDLGSVGDGNMIIDFNHPDVNLERIKRLMPHELTHQIMANNDPQPEDTVLNRIFSEGFATYAGYRFFKKQLTPAENLLYSEAEWQWCLKNEKRIYETLKPFFASLKDEDEAMVGSRNVSIFDGAPGAIGYFVGFRISQKYVEKNGEDRWIDLYRMTPQEALTQSGYGAFISSL